MMQYTKLCLSRLYMAWHTSSASKGHAVHPAASTADAVAGPTPFKDDVSAVTAAFSAS